MSTITDLTLSTTASDSMGIINTNFDNLNADKLEKSGGTMTGQINFSGTTHAGVKLNSLTTTQRDALTPEEGMIIYNSTTSQVEVYQGGAWVSSSSGVSDATETVKGIGEIATQAEIEAGTELGGTGASLIVNPKNLKSSVYYTKLPSSDEKAALAGTSGTPSGTNKFVTNDDTATSGNSKVIRSDANGKISDSLLGLTTAGDITYSDGTELQRLSIGSINKVLISTGTTPSWSSNSPRMVMTVSDTLQLSADTERIEDNNSDSYFLVKEFQIFKTGDIRVKFDLKTSNSNTVNGRIYKNGVAIGTVRSNSTINYVTYSEDFTGIAYGDKIQLYLSDTTQYNTRAYCQNFRIYYTETSTTVMTNLNIDANNP